MSIATDTALNAYAQALGQIANLEAGVARAIQDFKSLKEGTVTLDQLVVSDDGWQFMAPEPMEETDDGSNGTFAGNVADTASVG